MNALHRQSLWLAFVAIAIIFSMLGSIRISSAESRPREDIIFGTGGGDSWIGRDPATGDSVMEITPPPQQPQQQQYPMIIAPEIYLPGYGGTHPGPMPPPHPGPVPPPYPGPRPQPRMAPRSCLPSFPLVVHAAARYHGRCATTSKSPAGHFPEGG